MRTLWTTVQMCRHVAVPEATARYWRHVGSGPEFIRVGRHVRYRPEDVEAWLSAQSQQPRERLAQL